MPGRSLSASRYRYGFNGKENDNEVKGEGGQQDYGMRVYDPRVGRFLSVDPVDEEYPELTPYQFSSNCPIVNIDQDGLEAFAFNPKTGETTAGPLYLPGFQAKGYVTGLMPAQRSSSSVFRPQTKKEPILQTVSESTCQGCADRSRQLAASTATVVPKPAPTISQGQGTTYKSTSEKKRAAEKGDPYSGIIKKERQANQSIRAGDGMPMVGSLVQGVRRLSNDDESGAKSSFRSFGGEVALNALPIMKIAGGLKSSILYDASNAAFKAADDAGAIFIKNKHLNIGSGNFAKFATTDISTAQNWVQQALRSPNAMFLPNPQIPNTFQVITDLGLNVGTKGQTSIRSIVSFEGKVINAFPVK